MSKELYTSSIKTSTKMGKRELLIKASVAPRLMAFEVSFADSEVFMFLIAQHFIISEGNEHLAVGMMDSESAQWGEIACQMFEDPIQGYYKPGSILLLDPCVTRGGFVKNEVVFSDDFDMDTFISALMGTLALFRKNKKQVEYFVFLGNEYKYPEDKLWRKKFEKHSFNSFDLIKSYVGGLVPGCFLSVWRNTPNKRCEVKCVEQGALPWKDYAKTNEE